MPSSLCLQLLSQSFIPLMAGPRKYPCPIPLSLSVPISFIYLGLLPGISPVCVPVPRMLPPLNEGPTSHTHTHQHQTLPWVLLSNRQPWELVHFPANQITEYNFERLWWRKEDITALYQVPFSQRSSLIGNDCGYLIILHTLSIHQKSGAFIIHSMPLQPSTFSPPLGGSTISFSVATQAARIFYCCC